MSASVKKRVSQGHPGNVCGDSKSDPPQEAAQFTSQVGSPMASRAYPRQYQGCLSKGAAGCQGGLRSSLCRAGPQGQGTFLCRQEERAGCSWPH